MTMKKHLVKIAMLSVLALSLHSGSAMAQGSSHLEVAITNLKIAINEAIQCGGGGRDGAGCKGARGEAIALMRQALAKLEAARTGK
jgi:uncharacterized protein (UPF0261 family)